MRYFHRRKEEAEEISNYVRSHGLVVAKCHYAQEAAPVPVDADSIDELYKRSETLWGGSFIYYLVVSTKVEGYDLSLKDAVIDVEACSSPDKFLVVTHQDGGLVSVSSASLPFQAEAAEWWKPYRYADCD
jgi:hypothetical protein